MGAVVLWVRSILRRRVGATVALAVFAGLTGGIVGAAFQSARRADGSVERHAARSRSYDLVLSACPPEVADPGQLSFAELIQQCIGNDDAQRFASAVVAPMPQVESWSTVGTLVAGVLDGSAPNGWGHGVLVQAIGSSDPAGLMQRAILVDGHFPDERATDEVVIGELAARAGNIHVGENLRLASWSQQDLDGATGSGLAPTTTPFESTVVGIVRTERDVQLAQPDVTGAFLPDGLYAGPGWTTAHSGDLAMFGFGVAVRLVDGPQAATSFPDAVEKASAGWAIAPPDTVTEVDRPTLERAVEAERQALLISAGIALVAAVVFVGLTLARQLRRELADGHALAALGLTRRGVVSGVVIRSLAIGALGVVISLVTIEALSPLGPLGIARRLEYSHPIRFDWFVLAVVAVALPVLFAAVATASAVLALRHVHRSLRGSRPTSFTPLGAVPRAAMSFVRGASPRLAACVGAVAVAGTVAAGGLVASFDDVVDHPDKYGAWWDVAVGQYSDLDAEQAGVETIVANPAVADAAGFLEDTNTALADGIGVPFVSLVPYVGDPHMVMASGQEPVNTAEVALGAVTARQLHKGIGDTLTIGSSSNTELSKPVTVTGIAVLNNPVSTASNAGQGVVMHPDLAAQLDIGVHVPQSILIRLSPSADRQAALASVFNDFPGSARIATPQADLTNLERLRFAPWLIAALVGVLALSSLIHALFSLLQRHARDLAVLGVLGMTKRQRRRIGLDASVVIIGGCIVVGVPAGLVLGRWIWRVVARRISIPSGPVMAWAPTVMAPLCALAVAVAVATLATTWVTRRSPAVQLRTE